jgi:hypothetical protein
MTNIENTIARKISAYKPKGGLETTANLFLAMAKNYHFSTMEHAMRVGMMCEEVAKKQKKDKKAAFFAGLLHDMGKILLPSDLFSGRDISDEEYLRVKEHALVGFKSLKKLHMFTAFCAGFHHNLYKRGYGLSAKDFPKTWSPCTIKKVLDISTIVSICDFIDAFTNRKTKIKSGGSGDLKKMLLEKYPDDQVVVQECLNSLMLFKG